ncbi:long-chain-fatty-acid--CoA ligase ACSBG2-like isoform X1 [Acipenser ruthenus]|uniref:long-chain-fatty-acid--CoA ligase ACSBG2-like isoform X1 n=2 Tax=Acipenser ruthenus TaxID=7906 RepID=UPI00145BF6BF|nr:long-chain-fatty-acid--CoA ligase ACSBG2-like isoform X1 [Acipenser ruthenus]XP_034768253.2 long-chain-fatty-acid--CoA ligase ACSBG2-like isoform X1 [Acipenser ruthenus]
MHLTLLSETTMTAAAVMEPTGEYLQSCSPEECDVSVIDVAVESPANDSSEEECSSEREEEADTEMTPALQSGSSVSTQESKPVTANADVLRPDTLNLNELKLCTTKEDGEVKLRMGDSGQAAEPAITVNQMFLQTVEQYGDQVALASKDGDNWNRLTYKEYYQRCRTAAKSFLKLGLERYHGVGILGFNSPEWFIADIGAILAGGFAVGIYTTNSPEACQYVAENCKANVLVVENHKQLQKILQIQDKLPHVKAIIQYKDALKEKKPNLYTWAEFMEMGTDVPDSQLDEIIASQKPNQCCTLIYTSGTTGQPKGVMLSHDNITWTASATGKTVKLKHACEAQEVVVSYLPLSHIAAQMIDIWLPIKYGGVIYFAQPDALKGSLAITLKEVRPTAFMGVPRVWEKMQEKMKSVGAKSSTVQRRVASWAKDVGLQTNLNKMHGNSSLPFSYRLAKKLVFKKVRKALGLDRCTKCYTGAAPITKDTLEFFLSLDIPLYELYGMSESTGPHTISIPSAHRLTSCGKVISGCETKIFSPDSEGNGEICFWGRHVFMGYLNMEDKTEESLDSDGWLHSGDLGKHDKEGFLFITGRIKELIITAGGENIPPVPTEDALKELLPVISNAMLIGDKKKFLSMLLTLKCNVNPDSGEPEDELTPEAIEFCQKLGSKALKVSDIVGGKDRAVHKAIQEGIDRVNEQASSNAQKIQKWTILEKDFSLPGGELGPTMKLKRPVVMKMYKDQIDNFYKDVITPTVPENPLSTK